MEGVADAWLNVCSSRWSIPANRRQAGSPVRRAAAIARTCVSRSPDILPAAPVWTRTGARAPEGNITGMYSVAKRIEFCYGHRLLDYDGVCAHPHGHNAVAELEIRIRHARRAQHGDGLQRHQARDQDLGGPRAGSQDDPAARTIPWCRCCRAWGAGVHPRHQSHRGTHRAPDLRRGPRAGAARVARHGVGNADVLGHLRTAWLALVPRPRRLRSRRYPRRFPAAISPSPPTSSLRSAAASRCRWTRSLGWWARAPRCSCGARSRRPDCTDEPGALLRFLEIYDERLLRRRGSIRGCSTRCEAARRHARVAVLTNKPLRHSERLLDGTARPGAVRRRDRRGRTASPQARSGGTARADGRRRRHGTTDAAGRRFAGGLRNGAQRRCACCLVTFGFGFSRVLTGTLARRADRGADAPALASSSRSSSFSL